MITLIKRIAASLGVYLIALPVFAEEVAATAGGGDVGLIALGAGLGLGLAAAGAGSAQGKAAAAALDGIACNPSSSGKMFVPFILGLALMESLVILTFIVALQLAGKV